MSTLDIIYIATSEILRQQIKFDMQVWLSVSLHKQIDSPRVYN
jgi:hypothetical protein